VRTPISIGVVGYGRRGAAVARAFHELPGAELRWLCDGSREAQRLVRTRFPAARPVADVGALLADETLDAVVVTTPSATHAGLVRRCLEAQKHVLVEQPLALSARESEELVALAARRGRLLMVAEPLLFQPATRKLKELIELGRLGDVYYLHVIGHSPTREPGEESVLWSLGVTEVTVLLYLLADQPVEVFVHGDNYAQPGALEVAACWLRFATGITATLHLSWLDPSEERRVTVVGSRRSAVLDSRALDRKLCVHERVADDRRSPGEELRHGEIVSPRLSSVDPVRLECESFVAAIRSGLDLTAPRRAAAAVAIVEELERAAAETEAAAAARAAQSPGGAPRLQLVTNSGSP
jgi:predicted dehydrogenase